MIITSQDHAFTALHHHRFTQYRCPGCGSCHVAYTRLANIRDGSSELIFGEGDIVCQSCALCDTGYRFQVHSQSHADETILRQMMRDHITATADSWSYLRGRNFRD